MNNQPKPEWGFYAMTPRIVRTRYKDLSHTEKWLYTCLKDLCGDKGSCFRSLRALSEETDISTGSLSKMIPHLDEMGLIHAEKKKRTASGKEIWHITIVDIWQENAKACSKNEQSSDEIVQEMNNIVQKMNETPEDCSKNERDCSNFVDRRITIKKIEIEEDNKEEESIASESAVEPLATSVALTPASQISLSSFSQEETQEGQSPIATVTTRNVQSVEQQSLIPDLPKKSSSKKKETHTEPLGPKKVPEMPPADMAWGTKKCTMMFDAWRGHTLIGYYKLTQASTCAKEMSIQYTEEEVTQVYQSMNSDPYWQERGGADIGNVASNIHKEIKKVKRQKQPLPSQAPERPSFLVSEERRNQNLEKLRQRAIASGNYKE